MADTNTSLPFWRTKSLAEMSRPEWESLCDGCGQCCRVKLIDDATGRLYQTTLACKLLDVRSCRCRNYSGRHQLVDDCVALTAENIQDLSWMPETCAYRRLANGLELEWWHPLVSGSAETVHEAGISVRGQLRNEDKVKTSKIWNYAIEQPGE